MEISIFIIYKIIELIKKPAANKIHIAVRGLVVRQLPPIHRGSFRSSVRQLADRNAFRNPQRQLASAVMP